MADPGAPGVASDDAEAWQENARELVTRLFVCIKLAFVFDVGNAALDPPTQKLAEVANRMRERAGGVAALQFLSDGVYVNRVLVKVDAATLDHASYLFGICTRLGVGEVAATSETSARDWLEFLAAFKRAVGPGGDLASLRAAQFRTIRLRELKASGTSASSMQVTERFRALRAYGVATILIGEQVARVLSGKRLQPAKVKRGVQELLALTSGTEPMLLALVNLKRHKRTHEHHLANTAVLATLVGRRLGLDRNALCELGMQAAFHDIGDALLRPTPGHDRAGGPARVALETVRILLRSGAGPTAAARAAVAGELGHLLEPQAHGGELYPAAPGVAARVLAVAHELDALTTPRRDHPGLPPDEALRALESEADRRFDPTIARLLAATIGVYPLGSLVALSTGETAIVVEAPADPARRARPRVKLVRDAAGLELDGVLLDLADEPPGGRRILGCLDEEEEDLNPLPFLLG